MPTGWLRGEACCCEVAPPSATRPVHLALLGPPGVGKGTQAERLSELLGCCHLSAGDLFRWTGGAPEAERSSALCAMLKVMQRGELVPDGMVIALLRERTRCLRCGRGFLLDGFPRTLNQAKSLDEMLASEGIKLDAVINYHIDQDVIVERLRGRRVCAGCGAIYHVISRPPVAPGLCDLCGTVLIQRKDDSPDVILTRLKAYEELTAPLIGYYSDRGLLLGVDAKGPTEQILVATLSALGKKVGKPRLSEE